MATVDIGTRPPSGKTARTTGPPHGGDAVTWCGGVGIADACPRRGCGHGEPSPVTLDKTLMPVPGGHPAVFERSWPLRVGDIDRSGRLRLDAAARLIQDIGQDQVHALGFDKTHPVGVVRRTMIDLIRPIEFQDTLRLRRWCSGTSTRWCEIRVRIDGGKGGLIESEAFWINLNPDTGMPSRLSDDFLDELQRTTDVHRLRWKPYLTPGRPRGRRAPARIPAAVHRH